MLFMTLTLLLSPLSFGSLHDVSCQAALGVTPSYRSYANEQDDATKKLSVSEGWSPLFLTEWGKGTPWSFATIFDNVDLGSTWIQNRGRLNMDWEADWHAAPQSMVQAAAACSAACSSDDVDVVANAYFQASSDIFSQEIDYDDTVGEETSGTWQKRDKTWATCGYFRSEYTAPSSNAGECRTSRRCLFFIFLRQADQFFFLTNFFFFFNRFFFLQSASQCTATSICTFVRCSLLL